MAIAGGSYGSTAGSRPLRVRLPEEGTPPPARRPPAPGTEDACPATLLAGCLASADGRRQAARLRSDAASGYAEPVLDELELPMCVQWCVPLPPGIVEPPGLAAEDDDEDDGDGDEDVEVVRAE